MNSRKPRERSTTEIRNAVMLGMLRDARAQVHRNAESFHEAAAILEHVGQMLEGVVKEGLGGYRTAICKLARRAPAIQSERIEALFHTVKNARNDSVHSGDFIRHHAARLVELLLVLEEGLSMSAKIAEDLMVRNPMTAEPWHNIAAVRRAMLGNSFSFLPVRDTNGVWKLLSDVAVVKYLEPADNSGNKNLRNELLGKPLQEILEADDIELTECKCYSPNKDIGDIKKTITMLPVLIVEKDGNKERLVGILTAFDLL
jgi:CBS domain-containing protein